MLGYSFSNVSLLSLSSTVSMKISNKLSTIKQSVGMNTIYLLT